MPRPTRSILLALTFAALIGGAATARTRPQPERRASLLWLLASVHERLDKAALDSLGPHVEEMLIDIANSPREKPRIRSRALAGLAFYPTEGTFAFLSSLLNERNLIGNADGLLLRRQAIRSLGAAYGDRAVDGVLELKDDPEPGIRQAVAQALGDSGSVRALPTLELWLTTEQDLAAREAVDHAVNQLRGR